MYILFGEVEKEFAENSDTPILDHDGKYYDFGIKIEEEDFTFFDTVGNKLPVNIRDIDEMYQALKLARNYAKALIKSATAINAVNSDETLVCE